MSKKETWIVTLNTNIGSEDSPDSRYEPDFEKRFFAFDTFEEAKVKAFELIKSYAFTENSMFDGAGGIKRWKTYLEGNGIYEEDDEHLDEDCLNIAGAYNIFTRWLNGEQIDLSNKSGSFEFDYKIEIIDDKKLRIQNASRLLYGWIITTDMMNITASGNYSLYIRDNFDWEEDDPSILQVDIAKTNDYMCPDILTESEQTKDSRNKALEKLLSNIPKKKEFNKSRKEKSDYRY